ncbi:type IV toxin-antitoxin system AbiEi family antitoxin domain-containing protein [Nocardioides sp.]|uniref:type IV toxin-antitoxin system AbiEi family antitoxin domain-containing protein n=1 Tax=Nocardioides sp. TaxID=35761 RepID=UPI0025FCB953|nr:type IV toxin-antitoxin system AbiEi family antitoxin domain-containing protein [Nocardioides sp.]
MSVIQDPSGEELTVLERLLERSVPFTAREAVAEGASYGWLRRWCRAGLLGHPIRGVYHAPDLPDGLSLRLAVLRLVVPPDCVVTDRTAGWLWGANMILAPGDHLVTPAVQVFCPPGYRLRNGLVDSGERRLAAEDVAVLDGVRVTTPLRTACDLGRLLHVDQALAAMDSLAGLRRFTQDELELAVLRFGRYRGVVQLRALVPLVDPMAKSPGESALRLRWIEGGVPRPQCQVPVRAPDGGWFYLDMGLPDRLFGAEYDGEEFHDESVEEHDTDRREWCRREHGWTVLVFRKNNVYGRNQDADRILRRAWSEHSK